MMIQQKKQNENYTFKRLANLLILALLILELISCTTHRKVSDYEKTIAHAPTAVKEHFNQKNSSQLCCGVRNEEGVSLEGETMCPLPIQNGFLNPFDTS
jgi:hypothetical protein